MRVLQLPKPIVGVETIPFPLQFFVTSLVEEVASRPTKLSNISMASPSLLPSPSAVNLVLLSGPLHYDCFLSVIVDVL